jgi:hypothetical protein
VIVTEGRFTGDINLVQKAACTPDALPPGPSPHRSDGTSW